MSIKGEILMELLEDHDILISKEISEFADHLSEEHFSYPIEPKTTTEKHLI